MKLFISLSVTSRVNINYGVTRGYRQSERVAAPCLHARGLMVGVWLSRDTDAGPAPSYIIGIVAVKLAMSRPLIFEPIKDLRKNA